MLDHRKSKRIPEKKSTSASLTTLKPLTLWITANWKILTEMGIPDHVTCLLINLYAGQEATVRTGHGTTDCFQIGKGVRQGCTLSPCLFNFYAEFSSVQLSCSVVPNSLRPHALQHTRPPRPSPSPGASSNSCPLSW